MRVIRAFGTHNWHHGRVADKSNTPDSPDDLVAQRMKTAERSEADSARSSSSQSSAPHSSNAASSDMDDTVQFEAYPAVRRQESRVRKPSALSEEEWRYLGDRGAGRTAKASAPPVELLSQTRLYRRFTFFDFIATAWMILAIPFITLAIAVRAVASGVFLKFEYFHRPGFPGDDYGFSAADRLHFGSYTVDYLYNADSKRYLADIVAGNGVPVFNDAEIAHMADVKGLIQLLILVAVIGLIGAVFAGLYLSRTHGPGLRIGMRWGAILTLASVLILGILALIGWESFFRGFHQLFFSAGTWEFYIDDSLIRLFPQTFWMDAGIAAGLIILLISGLLIGLSFIGHGRRKQARAAVKEVRRQQEAYNRSSEEQHRRQAAGAPVSAAAASARGVESAPDASDRASDKKADKKARRPTGAGAPAAEDHPTEAYSPEDIAEAGKKPDAQKKGGLRKTDGDFSLGRKRRSKDDGPEH